VKRNTRGFTVLEAVFAAVLLTALIVPLATTFSSLRTGFVKIGRHSVALGLARAVMDHVHFKLYNDDARFVDMLTKDSKKIAAAEAGEGKEFFESLIETGHGVTNIDPGNLSTYFVRINDLTKSGEFGITPDIDPDLYRQLRDYRCSVDVYYSFPYAMLDSDVDGKAEVDMAEVKVEITWKEEQIQRRVELWSVFTKRQYNDVQ